MKKNSLALISILSLVGIGTIGTYSVSAAQTNSEIIQSITGKTLNELGNTSGKTMGMIAKENGKLDEFKLKVLENKKEVLNDLVSTGKMTQGVADDTLNQIKANQDNCDGTGNSNNNNLGLGLGQGQGRGNGLKDGSGMGQGRGNGLKEGGGVGSYSK